MSDAVRRIADAVLYEGYILWPYRRSATKNQQRWTFGGVFPPVHTETHPDDPSQLRAEVELEGDPDVDVRVRFLHVVERSLLDERGAAVDELDGLLAWDGADRTDALRQTLCSTHAVLRAEGGAFVSATESDCDNAGLWPVLVGEPGRRDTVLAAPIILSDYPQIAPESPGDLFDATEIDKLLILNVLALTPEEQAEMRASDPRAREILDRCASLSAEDLMRLHGAIRELRPLGTA